uniref:Uncharacterized protein n=2 Tax=Tetraodon nigroviridis TaxID=99883 RepID=H3CES1_TETNG
MSVCVEDLRTFVLERLTVAAEEILRVFHQKIEGYEDEVNYQRRLVESVWRPEIKLHRTEFSQPPVCQEEEVPAYQQQDRSSSLDQEDSEPPPIKEEQEEPWCHQDREQLTVKEESDTSLVTHIQEEDDQREDQILDLNPAQSDEKSEMDTTVGSSVSPEPDCDQQLPSNSPHVAESQDQEDDNNKDSESTADEELKPTVKQNKRKRHRGNANNPADSAVDCDTHTGATSATFTAGEKVEQFKSDLTEHWRIQSSDNQAAAATTCGKGLRGSGCEVTPSAKPGSDEHIKAHTGEKS